MFGDPSPLPCATESGGQLFGSAPKPRLQGGEVVEWRRGEVGIIVQITQSGTEPITRQEASAPRARYPPQSTYPRLDGSVTADHACCFNAGSRRSHGQLHRGQPDTTVPAAEAGAGACARPWAGADRCLGHPRLPGPLASRASSEAVVSFFGPSQPPGENEDNTRPRLDED